MRYTVLVGDDLTLVWVLTKKHINKNLGQSTSDLDFVVEINYSNQLLHLQNAEEVDGVSLFHLMNSIRFNTGTRNCQLSLDRRK